MRKMCGRARFALATGIVLACLLLCCPSAFALNPALDVSQYAHTAWKVRDGFFKSSISSIAQTPDGYLWLGTEFGLLRFDGVRAVPWQPPPGQTLPSNNIRRLVVSRDGTLWIGTLQGLVSWKAGRLTSYPELSRKYIYAFLEDREGTMWVGAFSIPPPGQLCAIRAGSVHCASDPATFSYGPSGLYQDRAGTLWVGVREGLWRWMPGPRKFYPLPGQPDGIGALGEDERGALLVGWRGGISRLNDMHPEVYPLPGITGPIVAHRMLRDHDGS